MLRFASRRLERRNRERATGDLPMPAPFRFAGTTASFALLYAAALVLSLFVVRCLASPIF